MFRYPSISLFLSISLLLHAAVISPLFRIMTCSSWGPLAGRGGGSGKGEVLVTLQGSPQSEGVPLEKKRKKTTKAGPTGSGPGEGSTPGIGSGPGGDDPILAAILGRIERAKRYPLLARKSGIEGRALIRFEIGARGEAEGIVLKSSSGSKLLDEEAVETIRRAAPFPLHPESLEVWIRFKL